jgi:hypothetical protein
VIYHQKEKGKKYNNIYYFMGKRIGSTVQWKTVVWFAVNLACFIDVLATMVISIIYIFPAAGLYIGTPLYLMILPCAALLWIGFCIAFTVATDWEFMEQSFLPFVCSKDTSTPPYSDKYFPIFVFSVLGFIYVWVAVIWSVYIGSFPFIWTETEFNALIGTSQISIYYSLCIVSSALLWLVAALCFVLFCNNAVRRHLMDMMDVVIRFVNSEQSLLKVMKKRPV